MYTTINEELRIQTCGIEDLLQEKPESFSEPLDNPETVTVIYDPVTDTVILNHDNLDYELYKIMVDTYLTVDGNTRNKLKQQTREITKHEFEDTFRLLDAVIKKRKSASLQEQNKHELMILGQQYIPSDDDLGLLGAIDYIENSRIMKLIKAYNWGYIQGIRAERARRKKVSL